MENASSRSVELSSSIAPRRTDAAELPVASEGGRDDLFGRARLRSDVVADRDVAIDDRVAEDPESFDLDLIDMSIPAEHAYRGTLPYRLSPEEKDKYWGKVERKNGRLANTIVETYPNVTQFWTFDEAKFLAAPVYSREYPPLKN